MDISEELIKLKLIELECEKITNQNEKDRNYENFTATIFSIISKELSDKYFNRKPPKRRGN